MGAHFLESCTYSTHTISIKLKLQTLLNIITTCLGGFCYSWLLPYWDLLQEIDLDTCPSIYNQAVPVWRLIWSMCMHCRQDSCRGSQKIGIPENRHQFAAFVACRLSSRAKVIFTLAVFIVLLFNHTVLVSCLSYPCKQSKETLDQIYMNGAGKKLKLTETEICYVMFK